MKNKLIEHISSILILAAIFAAGFSIHQALGTDLEHIVEPFPFQDYADVEQSCLPPDQMAELTYRLGYIIVGEKDDGVLLFHERTGNYAVHIANPEKMAICVTAAGNPNLVEE